MRRATTWPSVTGRQKMLESSPEHFRKVRSRRRAKTHRLRGHVVQPPMPLSLLRTVEVCAKMEGEKVLMARRLDRWHVRPQQHIH